MSANIHDSMTLCGCDIDALTGREHMYLRLAKLALNLSMSTLKPNVFALSL